jgi:hypothetical protein
MATIVCYDLMEEIGSHYKIIKATEKNKKKFNEVMSWIYKLRENPMCHDPEDGELFIRRHLFPFRFPIETDDEEVYE